MNYSNFAYVVAPFIGWIVAQMIKVALHHNRGIDWRMAVQSGGMPSSHAAFMAALTSSVAAGEGLDSVAFAICFALTSIVVYDATDVRLTTGQQTQIINKLIKEHKLKIKVNHDARGHTVAEVSFGLVIGIAIGISVAIIM